MATDLRRDIFRGMYNPVYRNPYASEKDDNPKNSHASFPPGWLSCIRLPRRQAIISFLNVLLLVVFIWHIPSLPGHSFLPVPVPHTNLTPQKPDFTPPTTSTSAEDTRRRLLTLSKNLSKIAFPKKIWQTWKTIALPNDETFTRRQTWHALNPTHEYDLLTDKSALDYVVNNFNATDPFIVHLYANFPQRILAADLLRYLIAFKSGGVYSDIDTECKKPIDTWVSQSIAHLPHVKQEDINIVVGMELDILDKTKYSDKWVIESGFAQRIQFIQWTIYAKPGHEISRRMITSVQEKVREDIQKSAGKCISGLKYSEREILDRTGPFGWTNAVMGYVNDIMGREVGFEEYTGIKEGKVFGDVLFLPVNRWSPGVGHSDAGGDETAFMIHHFGGSWRD
ncbi:membrane-bound alpha-1,6- mannosyltransferase Initiation-specific [Arthrobotrys megalospora]